MANEPLVATRRRSRLSTRWLGGGPDGNEQLTAVAGAVLLVSLALFGLTIVRNRQLLWLHMFVGMALIGPVVLKLASTGYRFVRYYSGDPAYRRKGPPAPALRALGPLVVVSTLVVFATGVVLLLAGPGSRGQLLFLHKASFFVWLAATGVHVLGHLVELPGSLHAVGDRRSEITGLDPGGAGRSIALAGAVVGGLLVAVLVLPDFAVWMAARFHR